MRYISLFSGIGGLEHPTIEPVAYVEWDPPPCARVLELRSDGRVPVHSDVRSFKPPEVDAVVGGSPCQDLSVAGKQAGLAGSRSGLFYEMVRVAKEAKAATMIWENVPRAYTNATTRRLVEEAIAELGLAHRVWRMLNARQFGLPHQRIRVFLVASKDPKIAAALDRGLPQRGPDAPAEPASAFYWTAGTQGICYSVGFSPTLKVGSGLSIPSPPAVFAAGIVRKLTPGECLALQGFDVTAPCFAGRRESDLYRMAGNVVARPVGAWVISCLDGLTAPSFDPPLATNLGAFLEDTAARLSPRAASGLLRRLGKSGKPCPAPLRTALAEIAATPVLHP